MNSVHYSSKTDEWSTPSDFFIKVNNRFNFTLDVCATQENAKCDRYFTKHNNGLLQTWRGERCWMNPPYGREIANWMKKAYQESHHATIVCLIPARTDTIWWHDYAMQGRVEFIKGRLRFGNSKNCAPFPSALVIYSQRGEIDE